MRTGAGAKGSRKSKKDAGKNEESDIFKIVKMVMERNFDPVRPRQGVASRLLPRAPCDDVLTPSMQPA